MVTMLHELEISVNVTPGSIEYDLMMVYHTKGSVVY